MQFTECCLMFADAVLLKLLYTVAVSYVNVVIIVWFNTCSSKAEFVLVTCVCVYYMLEQPWTIVMFCSR